MTIPELRVAALNAAVRTVGVEGSFRTLIVAKEYYQWLLEGK